MDLLRHTNLRILATFHSKQLFKSLKWVLQVIRMLLLRRILLFWTDS